VSLEPYKRKRDFGRTPEPSGDGTAVEPRLEAATAPAGVVADGRFVVQRHRARNLHYDFRLEMDGVLASWAVPKGPTLDASVRRGAFHVEDHPLDYYDFEGTIPAGQYGAGDVVVWDWGHYRPEATDDPGRAVADGELKFELFGEKLRGRFTIVRTRSEAGKEQWLLIKKRDSAAVAGWDVDALPRSVKTGRTNDEVAAGVAPSQPATGVAPAPAIDATPIPSASDLPGARSAPMPAFIEPMKATLADRQFDDPAWLFELKWDGYRVQARVLDGLVKWSTRRGQNALTYFPELAGPPTWLAAKEAILDGEVVALNERGEPDFGLLQAWRGSTRARRGADPARQEEPDRHAGTLAYEVFDLLFVDGSSLLDVPLEDRKQLLRSIMRDSPTVRYAGHVVGEGTAFYAAVAERGLEGMVAKLRRSRYEPGRRSPAWLKIKRRAEQEFVIGGWAPRAGSDSDLGALLIGTYEDGVLRPAGRVGTGFDATERARLLSMLTPIARSTSPFRPAQRDPAVHWVEPRLVARVEFAEWSADGALRAPSYKGLDIDADPGAVVREAAAPTDREVRAARATEPADGATSSGGGPTAPTGATPDELAALDSLPSTGGMWTVGGRELKLSNLDKPIWPADSIVKRDLIRYYASIAPFALPYLRDRALTVMRHPDGIDRPGFWQKQLPGHTPAWVSRWSWESVSADEIRDYAVADSVATLAWLANEAAIDLHPSTYRIDAPDRPTWALIDIDPGERTTWEDVLMLARLYRTALEHIAVAGFPKVSGRRGIQVWIPIRPIYTFDQTRDWVLGISRAVGAALPELVSWEWEKTRRGGLARLDYTQNAFNKTLVAPYAVRPAAAAPVSAPVSWDEIDDPTLRPDGWTIRTIMARLALRGDLFEAALGLEQELPAL
jgi:bifunctional non-homologous end joining protein LigD